MKKSTTMLDFFKRKCSNSSELNVGLPTTNVAIPIPENVDAPILEDVDAPILENVEDAPILENVEDAPILETVDAPILENVHFPIQENVDVLISQTQFQRVDLDSLDYDPVAFKLLGMDIIQHGLNILLREDIMGGFVVSSLSPNSFS